MSNTKKEIQEFSLELLNTKNLPELQGWKEKQDNLVLENPYIEIIDNKTYELACKSRTNLLKGRTELQNQDNLVASKLASFRKEVKSETDILILITQPSEDKQALEVKRHEGVKEARKAEKERLEKEREDNITKEIETFETSSLELIQKITIANLNETKEKLNALSNSEFDYEEFDVIFEMSKQRIQNLFESRHNDIVDRENQRLENERLQSEAIESKRVSDLQANRLNEIMPYVAFGEAVDLSKLSDMDNYTYESVLTSKKALFDANLKTIQDAQDKLDNENLEKDIKAEKEKHANFDIRIKRLSQIGVSYDLQGGFTYQYGRASHYHVYFMAAVEFEDFLLKIEQQNEIAKQKEQQEIKDSEERENQVALDLKKSEEHAVKLKAENKARIKKFVSDKKELTEFIESIEFRSAVPEMENEDSEKFLNNSVEMLEEFKKGLLININLI